MVEDDESELNRGLDEVACALAVALRCLAHSLADLGPRYARSAAMAARAVAQAEADGFLQPEQSQGSLPTSPHRG